MKIDEAIKILNTFKDLNDQMQPTIVFDAVDTAVSALESQRWIPVTERLPENVERALVIRHDYVSGEDFIDLLWYVQGCWWERLFKGDYAVTHWMPLPQLPKPPAPFPKGAVVEDDKSETILTEVKARFDSFKEELLIRDALFSEDLGEEES